MSDLRKAWRRLRRELWLAVSVLATERALDLCDLPEDERVVLAILDSTEVWIRAGV